MGLGLVVSALAEMPLQFWYEDYLADTNGFPVSANVQLQLQLYSSPTNGICLYEDSNTVEVVDGFYATLIGDNTVSGSLSNALAGGEIYVQVIADGDILTPREQLIPVPYALVAAGIPSNSVSSAMLMNGAVQNPQLADGAVTTDKLAGGVDSRYVNASGDTMSGPLTVNASANQTNLTVVGWAKIDYIPAQGGISMGIFTDR
jgi:hypothetical protein